MRFHKNSTQTATTVTSAAAAEADAAARANDLDALLAVAPSSVHHSVLYIHVWLAFSVLLFGALLSLHLFGRMARQAHHIIQAFIGHSLSLLAKTHTQCTHRHTQLFPTRCLNVNVVYLEL